MAQTPLTVHRIVIAPFVENLYEGCATRKRRSGRSITGSWNNVGDTLIWADGEALEKIILNLSPTHSNTPSRP